MRLPALVLCVVLLWVDIAFAQTPAGPPAPPASPRPDPALEQPGHTSAWSYEVSVYTYFVPDDGDFVQPTFAADRGRLHLEARYNYEDLETFSAWAGWNFSGGEALAFEFTPMLAAVFGNTNGFAPGYKGSLSWKTLELYGEGEYMFDSDGESEDFFYSWSQLTVAPRDGLRLGVVTQTTEAYQTDRDIQRGLLAGYIRGNADAGLVVFNPDDAKPTLVVTLAVRF